MNTKGTKFLAVLAVLAMAFAGFAVISEVQTSDAASIIELAGVDKKGTGYDYDGDTNTLTLTADIDAVLMFRGTDVKLGEKTTEAMFVAHGLVVKKTTADGAVYSSNLNAAMQAITAAQLSNKKVTITLLADVLDPAGGKVARCEVAELTDSVSFDEKLVVDLNLNGFTYYTEVMNGTLVTTKAMDVYAGQTWTIKNGTIKSVISGTLAEDTGNDIAYQLIQTYGNLTLSDVTLDITAVKTHANDSAAAIFSVAGGKVTLGSGVVINASAGDYAAMTAAMLYSNVTAQVYNSHVPEIVINGATLNGKLAADVSSGWDGGVTDAVAKVTVNSGIINGVLENKSITRADRADSGVVAADWAVFDIKAGTFTDYSVMNFITASSNIKIGTGEDTTPVNALPTEKTIDDVSGVATLDVGAITDNKTNSFVVATNAAIEAFTTDAKSADLIVVGKGNIVTGADLKVSADGSIALVGFGAITGDITTGTGTSSQKIALTGFAGNITVSKGSVVIEISDWTAGTINLDKDTIAKIRGTATGAATVNISYDGADGGSAKVIVEAGEGKELSIGTGMTIAVGANIDVEINGTVTGLGTFDVHSAKSVTINDGAVVDVANVNNTGKAVTVYSGADINGTTFSAFDKIAGKDAGSGKWSYTGTTLTLDNYNGTYNFEQIADEATIIELIGDSTITYTAPADLVDFDLFSALTTVAATVGSESLTINADISAVEDISVLNDFVVINVVGNFTLEQVNLAITITGSNAKWTAEKIALADVVGMIVGGKLTVEGTASLSVDVLSALTTDAAEIKGVSVTETTDIKSNSAFTVTAPANAFAADGAFTVKFESTVTINGDMTSDAATKVNNKSSLTVSGLLTAAALEVTLESAVDFNDVVLSGASSNDVEMTVNGNMLIASGTFTNNGKLTNNGTVLVIGNLTNNGTFDNNGTISVPANKIGTQDTKKTLTFTNNEYAQLGANVAMIKQISLTTTAVPNGTGTVAVAAEDLLVFTKTTDGAATAEAFTGTIVMTQDGKGYTIILENAAKTTKITIVYDSTKATDAAHDQIGTDYTVSVSGKVTVAGDLYNLTANTYKKDHAGDVDGSLPADATIFAANTGTFSVAKGTFTNAGSVIVSANGGTILAADATWNGPITANTALIIAGKFNGDILSNDGAIAVGAKAVIKGNITAVGDLDIDGTVTGNIVTKGTVSVDKKVTGNISTENEVTVTGELVGNVTITGASQFISTAGKMNGELTYNYAYLAKKGDAAKTEGSATMKIVGKATYTIALVAAVDAPSDSVDGTAGFFRYATAPSAVGTDGIEYTLLAGTFDQNSSVIMPVGSSFVVEAGTVFQIDKSFEFSVVDSALKISDSATANIDLGSDVPDYGVVTYVMSFTKTEGYTIYSNLAYALANADEGSVLTVGQSTVIKTSVEIGTGITVEVPKDIILTFQNDAGKSMNLSMKDGAKIELIDNGMVVFAASGDNTDDPELEAGDLYDYYSVSGTIVFGDNVVEFDGVRFTAESTVVGVAATETVPAKISTTLLYNEGTATIAAGVGTGSITLANDIYPLIKEDAASDVAVTATFTVAEGAVFDAVSITDAFEVVDYDENGEIVDVVKFPTYVYVNGILNLTNNTEIKGSYAGDGTVTLAADKQIVLVASDLVPVAAPYTNKTAPASLAVTIVDTTDDANGYVFVGGAMAGEAVTLKATTYKLGTETLNVMTISGDLGLGMVTATTVAFLDDLTIEEDAAVIADETYLVNNDSIATGYLMTKELYQKSTEYAALKELTYEVTFESEGYTVYTMFATVDFDEVSDITIADDFDLNYLTGGVAGAKYDLSGKDITITVAEGKVLTVNQKLIIGTPMTTLGGSAVISGTLKITGGNYIVAYSNVDLYDANILQNDGETVAVNSILTIEDVLYATLFANDGTIAAGFVLADADKTLVPEIAGFNFTKWYNLNEAAESLIGETNAYAGVKATLVTVTVKFVEGVSYYLNGTEFAIYDTPTKVDYNSVFTAKINNTAKYQGTPLINGQNSFQVTENATLTVTGVEPIPEPEPAPAGMSLTEILLIVLVVLIAIMVVIIALRLNRS